MPKLPTKHHRATMMMPRTTMKLSCSSASLLLFVVLLATTTGAQGGTLRHHRAASEDGNNDGRYDPIRPNPDRYIVSFRDASLYKSAVEKASREGKGGNSGAINEEERLPNLDGDWATTTTTTTKVHHQFDDSNAFAATMSPRAAEELRNTPGVVVEKDEVRYAIDGTPTTGSENHFRQHSRRRRDLESPSGGDDGDGVGIGGVSLHPSGRNSSSYANKSRAGRTNRQLQPQTGQVVPYGIKMVQARKVQYRGGKTICVIDSGYDDGHEDLPRFSPAASDAGVDGYGGNLPWRKDPYSHGTHVTGIIAAQNNRVGVVGVAPDANLYIVRVLGDDGYWAYESDMVDAVRQCIDRGSADIINISLGGYNPTTWGRQEMRKAVQRNGVLIVAAAGNDGPSSGLTTYPAAYNAVMAIAAVTESSEVSDFSTQDDFVELAAPGTAVLSTVSSGFGALVGSVSAVGGEPLLTGDVVEVFLGVSPGEATGPLVDCGLGKTECEDAEGKICVIRRGQGRFIQKVENCEAGGGVAAVIYNNEPGPCGFVWLDGNNTALPALCVSDADGQALVDAAAAGSSATVLVVQYDYDYFDGTSMSAPFVSGVAALVWSNHPQCTNHEIRNALKFSAKDVGEPGKDKAFGFGIVKAQRAHNRLLRNGCNNDNN